MKVQLIIFFSLLNFISSIYSQQKPIPGAAFGKYFLKQMNHRAAQEFDGVIVPTQISNQALYKNANSSTQSFLVDSVYIYNSKRNQREIYTYNSSNLITEDLIQQFSGNQWVNIQRVSNSYNVDGNLLSSTSADWKNNSWIGQTQSTFTYNANGQPITEVIEQAINDVLGNYSHSDYEYGNNNFLTSETFKVWQNEKWVNNLKEIFTNDDKGNLLSDLMQGWQNSTWKDSLRYTLTYDENSNNTSQLAEVWTTKWENYFRGSNTFDSNNNMVSGLFERWENNAWAGVVRNTYTYDNRNNRLQETDELYNGNQWNNQSRLTWTYDDNNNVLSHLIELTGPTGDWANNNKMEYSYDFTNNTATGTYYDWVTSSWVQADGYLDFYDGGKNLFEYYGNKVIVRFKNSVTSVTDKNVKPARYSLSQNYPNPFNPSTVISYQLSFSSFVSLKIYDILGREVSTLVNEEKQPGNYEVTFDASNLSSGTYFYRLQAGNFSQIKKMILLK